MEKHQLRCSSWVTDFKTKRIREGGGGAGNHLSSIFSSILEPTQKRRVEKKKREMITHKPEIGSNNKHGPYKREEKVFIQLFNNF